MRERVWQNISGVQRRTPLFFGVAVVCHHGLQGQPWVLELNANRENCSHISTNQLLLVKTSVINHVNVQHLTCLRAA